MPSYGDISMERDPFAPIPRGAMRANPSPVDPYEGGPPDPKAALALQLRRQRLAEDQARVNANPTIDVSDRNTTNPERLGESLGGIERFARMATRMPMDDQEAGDVWSEAARDQSLRKNAMTATVGGQNYSFQPRARIDDRKAGLYLARARQRRMDTEASEDKRAAKLEKMAATKTAEADKQYARMVEQQDKQTANERFARQDTMAERRAGAETRVLEADAERKIRENSPEALATKEAKEKWRLTGAALANSADPRAQAAALQMMAEDTGLPGLAQEGYEAKRGRVEPLVQKLKAAAERGLFTRADPKAVEAIKQRILRTAAEEGWTPEEQQALVQELESLSRDPYEAVRGPLNAAQSVGRWTSPGLIMRGLNALGGE